MKYKRRYTRRKSTSFEGVLWDRIRGNQLGYKFKRQHSIGPYIVDFYCASKRLVVEIDGSIHRTRDRMEYDQFRTRYFKSLGIQEIRFWNEELQNIESVINKMCLSLS